VWQAVVSQPSQRGARIAAPGKLDPSLGEFWVENPWDIITKGHNLSAYERDRLFLNVSGGDFADVSGLSGADSDGDGRSVVAADFRNNGQLDLLVRQVGGGPLRLFENQFPRRHFLEVSLRGTKSNRLGIGSRLVLEAGGRRQVREIYPINSFRSQGPIRAHFGLGEATKIDRLLIHWPLGEEQELCDLAGDRHIVVEEGQTGAAALETVIPGQIVRP
jgi:enediyne biosynthesis protein E4